MTKSEPIKSITDQRASRVADLGRSAEEFYPMKPLHLISVIITAFMLSACGTLEMKAALINPGDTKEQVLAIMGPPGDRHFRGKDEAWQYGQTGAGFGYHDF